MKQNIYLFKMNLKSWKHLIQTILAAKVISEEDGTQNHLVFQPMCRHFKRGSGVGSDNYICFWTSKWLSDENITAPPTSDHKLNPHWSYFGTKIRVEFSGRYLKQEKITHDHGKRVNIYIVYEIRKNFNIIDYPTLENCSCIK